jgi:hypothetical protein
MRKILPFALVATIVSCQPKENETAPGAEFPAETTPEVTPEPPAESIPETPGTETSAQPADPNDADSYVGMTLEAAEERADAAGIPHRVMEIDGESLFGTADYLENRLNFAVKDGVIIRVTKG